MYVMHSYMAMSVSSRCLCKTNVLEPSVCYGVDSVCLHLKGTERRHQCYVASSTYWLSSIWAELSLMFQTYSLWS